MFSANSSQVSEDRLYVEDVFSTWLYTGTPAYAQTIVNGIDLAGKGGLLWIKSRTSDTAPDHYLNFNDGSNIVSNQSNNTSARQVMSPYVAFNSNGFYVNAAPGFLNNNGTRYASWTFRKAPKFFDVVTYTGTGSTQRIAHSLGVTPGVIIIKRTSDVAGWRVWHRSYSSPATDALDLNTTSAVYNGDVYWGNAGVGATPDATTFSVGTNASTNASGSTYVAYLFAHDTTSDGIIQCGSFTTDAGGVVPNVNLGWEPQWFLVKRSDNTGPWFIIDTMRGWSQTNTQYFYADTSGAEAGWGTQYFGVPTATGFQGSVNSGIANGSFIYIAIRRGPMRTPTSGTSVFSPDFFGGGTVYYNSGFPTDLALTAYRPGDTYNTSVADRLRGGNNTLVTSSTAAEIADTTNYFDNNVGFGLAYTGGTNSNYIGWLFRRAPSFFDVVCYTGNASNRTINHNLGVAPELMIIKSRSAGGSSTYDWVVYAAPTWGTGGGTNNLLKLNSNISASFSNDMLNNTQPTSSVFSLGFYNNVNASGTTYVAYLFASCPGVSKVGSYTGNGSSQTINCGFAAGARFVMIKRTDSAGNWCVWDTARGINPGGDPVLQLNNTFAEDNTTDDVDTAASGFVVNSVSPGYEINLNGATYIYLAVA